MIRDKNRIYAEENSPNTVLSLDTLDNNKPVYGNDNRNLVKALNQSSILITDEYGNSNVFSLPTGVNISNRRLGTDEDGLLTWL